jgi:hypothetical protein
VSVSVYVYMSVCVSIYMYLCVYECMCLAGPSYLVDACLSAGEGEGEAQRQLGALEAHVVQEVSDALYDVVKELQGESGAHARCALMGAWLPDLDPQP